MLGGLQVFRAEGEKEKKYPEASLQDGGLSSAFN